MDKTAQIVTAVSGPKARYPWLEHDGPMGWRRPLDPAAARAGLLPAVGDLIYVLSTPTPFGTGYFMAIEDSSGHMLISRGKDAWKPPVSDMGTRELLALLARIRRVGGWYTPYGTHEGPVPGYSLEEVKAELSRRPHVPTGAEAKQQRRERARGRASERPTKLR
jgi:hypothetical protein